MAAYLFISRKQTRQTFVWGTSVKNAVPCPNIRYSHRYIFVNAPFHPPSDFLFTFFKNPSIFSHLSPPVAALVSVSPRGRWHVSVLAVGKRNRGCGLTPAVLTDKPQCARMPLHHSSPSQAFARRQRLPRPLIHRRWFSFQSKTERIQKEKWAVDWKDGLLCASGLIFTCEHARAQLFSPWVIFWFD